MNKSKIEWCDYSINPVKGLCPMACFYCYARRMYKRFKWNPEIWFEPIRDIDLPKKPSKIFVGSTIELFGEWIDVFWLDSIFRTVKDNPQHTFIFLTKRPENLPKEFPPNSWVGASPINNAQLLLAISSLEKIEARIRFLSLEPLLNQLDALPFVLNDKVVDWVICGQQTPVKKATMPKIEWIREIVEACDKAGIPIFLKDNLESLLPVDRPFYKPIPLSGWDDNFSWELRQEFPK